LEGSAKEKNIQLFFEKSQEMVVYADQNMISAVLRNLLNNAIKFTPLGGSITIKLQDHGDFVSISVADTGIGMTMEKLQNLFDLEKYKSTPGTANEKGSGLGLIICKEFVEKNYGRISVKSEPHAGSEFSFILPKTNNKITQE
jgi:signal transduction histidine kinase